MDKPRVAGTCVGPLERKDRYYRQLPALAEAPSPTKLALPAAPAPPLAAPLPPPTLLPLPRQAAVKAVRAPAASSSASRTSVSTSSAGSDAAPPRGLSVLGGPPSHQPPQLVVLPELVALRRPPPKSLGSGRSPPPRRWESSPGTAMPAAAAPAASGVSRAGAAGVAWPEPVRSSRSAEPASLAESGSRLCLLDHALGQQAFAERANGAGAMATAGTALAAEPCPPASSLLPPPPGTARVWPPQGLPERQRAAPPAAAPAEQHRVAPSPSPAVISPHPVRPIESTVCINSLRPLVEGGGGGCPICGPLSAVQRHFEEWPAPALLTDISHRVRWVNTAYKKMVGQPECSWLAAAVGSGCGGERLAGEVTMLGLDGGSATAAGSMSPALAFEARICFRSAGVGCGSGGSLRAVRNAGTAVRVDDDTASALGYLWRFDTSGDGMVPAGT
eukprot:SM000029S10453  [mRNA]  locus=s29:271220:273303:- [translate_table: standard]